MNEKITHLYSDYKQGKTTRRDFLRKLALYTGSTAAALTMLPILENNYVKAEVPRESEEGLVTEYITYKGLKTDVSAFLARPEKKSKYPAVIVIHEIFGLNPHIEDVAKRFAKEGFLSIAPDALSVLDTEESEGEDLNAAIAKIRGLDTEETTQNFVAAVKYLKTHPLTNGKVGCTGFCWGGGMTNQVAVNCSDLDAAVPYYGTQPDSNDVPKIKAPVLAHYGENDERINAGIEAFEKALKESGKEYQIYIYKGAGHAFNNDSNPDRYHEEAAKLAWGRTVEFFKDKLT